MRFKLTIDWIEDNTPRQWGSFALKASMPEAQYLLTYEGPRGWVVTQTKPDGSVTRSGEHATIHGAKFAAETLRSLP